MGKYGKVVDGQYVQTNTQAQKEKRDKQKEMKAAAKKVRDERKAKKDEKNNQGV